MTRIYEASQLHMVAATSIVRIGFWRNRCTQGKCGHRASWLRLLSLDNNLTKAFEKAMATTRRKISPTTTLRMKVALPAMMEPQQASQGMEELNHPL